jgi:hypothetical protein
MRELSPSALAAEAAKRKPVYDTIAKSDGACAWCGTSIAEGTRRPQVFL